MIFDIDHVRDFINRVTIDPGSKVKDINYFTQQKNKSRFASKVLCLVVLQVKTPSQSSSSRTSDYNKNKRNKILAIPAKTYHRYFLCGDVSNPLHCFAIITHNIGETTAFTEYLKHEPWIGTFFYLIEPNLVTSTIGEYLNVIDFKDKALVPLKASTKLFDLPTDIVLPTTSEETFYFVLQNQQLRITKLDSTIDCCKGFASCLHHTQGKPLVYRYDIEFEVDRNMFQGERSYVATFSSFRLCTVFFHNFVEYSNVEYSNTTNPDKEKNTLFRRRSQFRRIGKYVNMSTTTEVGS